MKRRRVRFVALAVVASVVGYPATDARAVDPGVSLTHAAADWLTAKGFPVGQGFPVFCNDDEGSYAEQWGGGDAWKGAYAFSSLSGISYSPEACKWVRWLPTRASGPISSNGRAADTARMILHEILHRVGHESVWYREDATTGDRWLEEGITEQVARDLTPAFLWQVLRIRHSGPVTEFAGSYEDRAKLVRQISVVMTGSKNYRTGAARRYRFDMIKNPAEGRRAILDNANARRYGNAG